MSAAPATGPRNRIDRPTIEEARRDGLPFLHRINPLAKVLPTTAALIAILFTHNLLAPALVAGVSLVLLLIGGQLSLRQRIALIVILPLAGAMLAFTIGLWVDTDRTVGTDVLFNVGAWEFRTGGLESGLVTSLRLVAIVTLSLLSGMTTSGADFVRAIVQLGVPYRFGYAGLAGMRFVPRFRRELQIIRQAQRARGIAFTRGPLSGLRRQASTLVPLIAAALRHADRVALSMDARAFGYATSRTERHFVPMRATDWLFVGLFSAGVVVAIVLGAVL